MAPTAKKNEVKDGLSAVREDIAEIRGAIVDIRGSLAGIHEKMGLLDLIAQKILGESLAPESYSTEIASHVGGSLTSFSPEPNPPVIIREKKLDLSIEMPLVVTDHIAAMVVCEKLIDDENPMVSLENLSQGNQSGELKEKDGEGDDPGRQVFDQMTVIGKWNTKKKKRKRWKASMEIKESLEKNLSSEELLHRQEGENQVEIERVRYACQVFDNMRLKRTKKVMKKRIFTKFKGWKYKAKDDYSEMFGTQKEKNKKIKGRFSGKQFAFMWNTKHEPQLFIRNYIGWSKRKHHEEAYLRCDEMHQLNGLMELFWELFVASNTRKGKGVESRATMDLEQVGEFVMEYYKKVFKSAAKQLEEFLRQNKSNSFSSIDNHNDLELTKLICSISQSENDPTRYRESYSKLRSWTDNSMVLYKCELLRAIFPVFIYGYMNPAEKGNTQETIVFSNSFRFREEREMIQLRDALASSYLEELEFARSLLQNKVTYLGNLRRKWLQLNGCSSVLEGLFRWGSWLLDKNLGVGNRKESVHMLKDELPKGSTCGIWKKDTKEVVCDKLCVMTMRSRPGDAKKSRLIKSLCYVWMRISVNQIMGLVSLLIDVIHRSLKVVQGEYIHMEGVHMEGEIIHMEGVHMEGEIISQIYNVIAEILLLKLCSALVRLRFSWLEILKNSEVKLEEIEGEKRKKEELKDKFTGMCMMVKGEKVTVVFDHVGDSLCCGVTGEYRWIANIDGTMKARALGYSIMTGYMNNKDTMEINPKGLIVDELRERSDANKSDKSVKELVLFSLETTLLTSGLSRDESNTFRNKINRMLTLGLYMEDEQENNRRIQMPPLVKIAFGVICFCSSSSMKHFFSMTLGTRSVLMGPVLIRVSQRRGRPNRQKPKKREQSKPS